MMLFKLCAGDGHQTGGAYGHIGSHASGVLVVLVGPAVRLSEYVPSDKRYGQSSGWENHDTYDADGEITQRSAVDITQEQIEEH